MDINDFANYFFESKNEDNPLNNIINFNVITQCKFLYIRGKDKDLVYHIWGHTFKELSIIENLLKRKNNSKSSAYLSPGSAIKKEFAPVPFYHTKQQDGFYHAYIIIVKGGDAK